MLLYLIFCAACLLAFSYSARVDRYFRTRYPALWNSFGFAGNAAQSEEIIELLDLAAQRRYKAFLRSEDRRNLHDAKLDKMLSIKLVLNALALVLFIGVLARLALRFAPI